MPLVVGLFLLLCQTAAAQFPLGCPRAFNDPGPANATGNHTAALRYRILKRLRDAEPDPLLGSYNSTMTAVGAWEDLCVSKHTCRHSIPMLHQLKVDVTKGRGLLISSLVVNYAGPSGDAETLRLEKLEVPLQSTAARKPRTVITFDNMTLSTNGTEFTVQILLSSLHFSDELEANISLEVLCGDATRYKWMANELPDYDDPGFCSLAGSLILPLVTFLILIALNLVRQRTGVQPRLKLLVGFSDTSEELRQRNRLIKDKFGGNTWHAHASEIVSDLKKDKVDQLEADSEEEMELKESHTQEPREQVTKTYSFKEECSSSRSSDDFI